MKLILSLVFIISTMLHAQTDDERVLEMLKQLNKPTFLAPGAVSLPHPSEATEAQQKLALKSAELELTDKETSMLSRSVNGDLAFEQKLPRAVGYSKTGDSISGTVDFSGKRFRLSAGDVMAGWTIIAIGKDGIKMKSRNGYEFKSYFDIK